MLKLNYHRIIKWQRLRYAVFAWGWNFLKVTLIYRKQVYIKY